MAYGGPPMMRFRTVWDWRLRLYPLVVIPAIFYVAAQQDGDDLRSAVAAMARQEQPTAALQDAAPASAAPISGFHRGNSLTCFTHPKITLCYWMTKERR